MHPTIILLAAALLAPYSPAAAAVVGLAAWLAAVANDPLWLRPAGRRRPA